jgi:hypothetical protein
MEKWGLFWVYGDGIHIKSQKSLLMGIVLFGF